MDRARQLVPGCPVAPVAPDLLAPVANPRLYRRNAFRVAGLPADATSRDIRRRGDELRAAERLGAPIATRTGLLPLEPAPSAAEVREALQLLRDPRRRLVEEFFWFWRARRPDGEEPVGEEPVGGEAVHDLAVLTHAEALDRTLAGDGTGSLWQRAYRHWVSVFTDDRCWQLLTERVRRLDDRRLDAAALVSAIRAELPQAVLTPQAALAVRAAEEGQFAVAREHLAVLADSGFAGCLDDVLTAATKHITSRVRTLCQQTEQTVVADVAEGADAVDELIEQAAPAVRALETVLGDENPVYTAAADALALCVNGCVIQIVNAELDYQDAYEQAVDAVRIAASPQVVASLETTVLAAASHLIGPRCQQAAGRVEADPSDGTAITSLLDDVQPILDKLADLVDPDDERYLEFRDAVALCACSCLIPYHSETGDDATTIALLERVQTIAVGEQARTVAENTLTVVRSGHTFGCWYCGNPADEWATAEVELHGEIDYTLAPQRVTWQTLSVDVPRCGQCMVRQDKPRWTDQWLFRAGVVALPLAAMALSFILLVNAEEDPGPWPFIIGVLVLTWLVPFLIGKVLGWAVVRARRRTIDNYHEARDFPPVRQLTQAGYQFGARPPGL